VGSDKGSLTSDLIKSLRLPESSATIQPDPARQVDYQIVIGEDYNSCAAEGYRAGEE